MNRILTVVLTVLLSCVPVAAQTPTDAQTLQQLRDALTKAIESLAVLVPPVTTRVVVKTAAEFQAALDTAVNGQTIALAPGIYNGSFYLRKRDLTSFVTITTDGYTLPAGAPQNGTGMAVLQSLNNEPDLRTDPGAAYYRVTGITFGPTRGGEDDMVRCGDALDPVLANQPHHLEFIKNYGKGGENGQRRGIALNCAHSKALFNRFESLWKLGQDSQGIAAWSTSGPLEISNNVLEVASENILIGGASPAGNLSALVPSDVLIERNTLTKNRAWALAGGKNVKNLFELKFCRRCIVRGNVMIGNWSDAQDGYAILLTVATNQSGLPGCVACELVDILLEDNTISDVAAGIKILGSAYSSPSGALKRLTIRKNLFVIDADKMLGPGGKRGNGQFMSSEGGPTDILVERNTVSFSGGAFYAANPGVTWWEGPAPIAALPPSGVVIRANVFTHGDWGIITPLGAAGRGLAWFTGGAVVEDNVLIGGPAWGMTYPPSNKLISYVDRATVWNVNTFAIQPPYLGVVGR